MKYFIPFLISTVASTLAFADFDKELDNYTQRKHLQGTGAAGSGAPAEVFNLGNPRVPIFHAAGANPAGFRIPFSAILNPGAKEELPLAIKNILQANGIEDPEINIAFQGVDHDKPMIFKPQYFFFPDANAVGGGVGDEKDVEWLAVKLNLNDEADFSLMSVRPTDNELVDIGATSFQLAAGGVVIASPDDAPQLTLGIAQMRQIGGFQDFYSIAKDSSGISVVTLHWFLTADYLAKVVRAFSDSSTKTVQDFLQHSEIQAKFDPKALSRLRSIVSFTEAAPSQQPTASSALGSLASASASTRMSNRFLPNKVPLAHFWEQNPRAEKYGIDNGKFVKGEESEYLYAIKCIKFGKNITCVPRILPDDVDLKLFWKENPKYFNFGKAQGKIIEDDKKGEADRKAELAFAKLVYRYRGDSVWDPRELPVGFSLEEFWRLNPGIREWGLNPPNHKPRFVDGDEESERAFARNFYKWQIHRAQWLDPSS